MIPSRFMRGTARVVLLIAVAGIACGGGSSGGASATRMTEALRGLKFKSPPAIERIAFEDYQRVPVILSDEEKRFLRQTYGRLGFFSREPLALPMSAGGAFSSYDPKSKKILAVGEPATELVVFSLVNALEDQHFDLLELERGLSTDERLARWALIYGSATEVQARYVFEGESPQGWSTSLGVFNASYAQRSEQAFGRSRADTSTPVALFFLADAAFSFSYGATFVGRVLGVSDGAWQTQKVDALFASPPRSSEEILKAVVRYETADPIVDVSLAEVPALGTPLRVRYVDRLGAWYAMTLFRQLGATASRALELALAWDGDELAMLVHRAEPDETAFPQVPAVVWVSAWDDDAAAQGVVEIMKSAVEPGMHQPPGECSTNVTNRPPSPCVLREGNRVVFVSSSVGGYADPYALALAGLRRPQLPKLAPSKPRTTPPLSVRP